MRIKPMYTVMILLLATATSLTAQEHVPSTMTRLYDPVQVPGELLASLHGAPLDRLRLYAYKGGRMRQIPYQLDERLENGDYLFSMGPGANYDLANNKLDPQDLLMLPIEHTGGRAPKAAWPTADGIEIELVDPLDHGRSYCYLLRFPEKAPPRLYDKTKEVEALDPWENPDIPIGFEGESYRVAGEIKRVGKKVYKNFNVKSLIMPTSAGGSGKNFVDGLRSRSFIELLFGTIRIDLNESGSIGGVDQIHSGTVRGYGRAWMSMQLPMGIEGPRMYSDVFTYDRMILSPMTITMPFNPGTIITRGGISIGFDLNEHAYGMKLYTPHCLEGVTIDGKMTPNELALFPGKWVPWYAITGPQGSFIVRLQIDKAMLDQFTRSFEYTDDRKALFPPEDLPGAIGYARGSLEFTDFKPGDYSISYEWYFPPNFYDPAGLDVDRLQQYFNIIDAPIVIRVDGKEAKNMAMNPPPLKSRKKK